MASSSPRAVASSSPSSGASGNGKVEKRLPGILESISTVRIKSPVFKRVG